LISCPWRGDTLIINISARQDKLVTNGTIKKRPREKIIANANTLSRGHNKVFSGVLMGQMFSKHGDSRNKVRARQPAGQAGMRASESLGRHRNRADFNPDADRRISRRVNNGRANSRAFGLCSSLV
jgi:hypothetical protein